MIFRISNLRKKALFSNGSLLNGSLPSIILFIGIIVACCGGSPVFADTKEIISPDGLNLAIYQIKDPEIQKALNITSIPIRAANFSLPPLELPTLKMSDITEEDIVTRLDQLVAAFSGKTSAKDQLLDYGDILTVKDQTKIYWINRASSAWSYSETEAIMARRSNIANPKTAVELALKHVVKNNLVKLDPEESLDVIFVSRVMTAAVKDDDPGKTFMEYPSDYFVGLGRRYLGIPIVGSRLILRLGEKGELFGVQKTWRPIMGQGDIVKTVQGLELGEDKENNRKIDGLRCGYIEGPIKNRQTRVGVGCIINYRLLDQYEDGLLSSVKVIPLAEYDFPISGKLLDFADEKLPADHYVPVDDHEEQWDDEKK